ncbi:MAG: hypothetical protein ACRD2L_11305, partial [Terriglobia bacterium]
LLKRALKGTYVSVEPFHLFRYLDEESFRYNERKMTDSERFGKVLGCISGKRLTYSRVRGVTDDKAKRQGRGKRQEKAIA